MPVDAIQPADAARRAEAAAAAAAPAPARKADAAQKFEAFVLQTFIQEMMPETPEGVYGSGIAGDFWKSMMAEKIADQVAQRGSIGIADLVRRADLSAARPAGGPSPDVLSHLSTLGALGLATDSSSTGE